MVIDTETTVSISEANQNFSKVARLVDEKGTVIIMKNNKPRYIIHDASQKDMIESLPDEKFIEDIKRLLKENREAYIELAK